MKWPAHLEERACIFELTGADGEPLKGPTRIPMLWEDNQFIELDPDRFPRELRVIGVGRVGVDQTTNGINQ